MQSDQIICEFCKSTFACQKNLDSHKKMAKYCLKLQGKEREKYKCSGCDKTFSNNHWLIHHHTICIDYQVKDKTYDIEYEKKMLEKEEENLLQQLAEKTAQLEEKDRIIKDCLQIIKESKVSEDKVRSIERRIRPTRDQYPGKNYVYILTTPAQQEKRVYIFGKTVNLTNRLSTYNKSEEHSVVYHRECKTEAIMSGAETAIFAKLEGCRAMKNRERFILPEGKDISYFTGVVDDCVAFFS